METKLYLDSTKNISVGGPYAIGTTGELVAVTEVHDTYVVVKPYER